MHRPDAATVSYTEIEVDPNVVRMRYLPCAPCRQGNLTGSGHHPSAIPGPARPDGSGLILAEHVLDRL